MNINNVKKNNTKILVIDDEPGIRNLLSYELGMLGYAVMTSNDGEEGLDLINNERFNLVISDIKMPKKDGLQILEITKAKYPQTEVIMMTGFGTINTAIAALKMGAYDFIQKPFNLEEMLGTVEKALEKAELKALVTLYDASKAIFSTIKLEDLLPVLIELSFKILKADDISIVLVDQNNKLNIASSSGLENDEAKQLRLSLCEKIMNESEDKKAAVIITNHSDKNNIFAAIKNSDTIKSSILCPLFSQKKVTGILCAARVKNEVPLNIFDDRYLNIFVSQISQAIDNARLYKELEEKIEALDQTYKQLSAMQAELVKSEKLAAIGQLSAGVAHELNNPLTIVTGLTDLLLEDTSENAAQRKDLLSIKEQAERCRKIILNLLQFSQKNESEKKFFKINSLLEKTIELMEFNLYDSSIEMIKDFDSTIPNIELNSFKMQQVFINIINNAIFALKDRPNPKLIIKTQYINNTIKIYFIDNGCGILKNNVSKIFDPFFSTKEVGKGTGLGLSISYGIVREHGGEIRVQSQEGEGCMFSVELPCSNK